jgi:hypothetical protein
MRYKLFYFSTLLALVAVALAGSEAAAGSVEGSVRDMGKNPPANGLSGAKVWLHALSGKESDPVITNTDGQYHIANVANGEYKLVVAKVGYVPNPHDRTQIIVKGDAKADDVLLMQAFASQAYYSTVANGIVKNVAATPTDVRQKVLTHEWDNLRAINLPPSSKAILASEWNKQDAKAKELLPDLEAYVAAKPESVLKAQTLFGQALVGKGKIPGKDTLNDLGISDEVVADLVLFQIKGSTEPEWKRKVFVNEFLQEWNDTPASKRFVALEKHFVF